jgi:hypothetical protein
VFGASAAPANAAAAIETMPLSRLQVVITTGGTYNPADTVTTDDEGTDGNPALRFNGTTTGVRTLNPPARNAFDAGHVDTYDLRLFGSPSELTMLRIGIAGTDSWCVKKVELRFNGRSAFVRDAVPGGSSCVSLRGGSYLEYSSADLRNNPAWTAYGTPPALPSSMSASSLRTLVRDVTGSAMLAQPSLRWDPAVPFSVVRTSTSTVHVSFGLLEVDPTGIDGINIVRPSYIIGLYVGADGKLHATLRSWNVSNVTIQPVVTQLDAALSRMTARTAPHDPLRFAVDTSTNINWSYTPVLAP